MRSSSIKTGAAVFAITFWLAAPALAICRDVTVSASGAEKRGIDDAKASAMDALVAKVASGYGKKWGVGSHRNGSFHCDNILAGPHPGWTCTAKTTAICARD